MKSLSYHVTPAEKANESHLICLQFSASMVSISRDVDLEKIDVSVDGLHEEAKTVWKVECLPKSLLKKYSLFRSRAEECCSTYGVKTDHGFVAIKSRATGILNTLTEIMTDWGFAKKVDLENYESICQNHLMAMKVEFIQSGLSSADSDKLVQAIKSAQPSKYDFERKVNFTRQGLIIPIDEEDFDQEFSSAQQETAKTIRKSTMQSLVNEICSKALKVSKLLSDNERGTPVGSGHRVHSRTVKSVMRLQEKLYELSFIHKHVKTLHDAIADVMRTLSSNDGALRDKDYQTFREMMITLSNHDEIQKKLINGDRLILVINHKPNNVTTIDRNCEHNDLVNDLLSVDLDNKEDANDTYVPAISPLGNSPDTSILFG